MYIQLGDLIIFICLRQNKSEYSFNFFSRIKKNLIALFIGKGPTCHGDQHLGQARSKRISNQHGTAHVASGSLVILNGNHAVDV